MKEIYDLENDFKIYKVSNTCMPVERMTLPDITDQIPKDADYLRNFLEIFKGRVCKRDYSGYTENEIDESFTINDERLEEYNFNLKIKRLLNDLG